MRRIKPLIIALLIMVSALYLTACNETGDKHLESIYDKYVTYTEENGKETLYYEEWLATNSLEFGKNGKTAYEIYKEKNNFDGNEEDWEYYLITGLKPQSHFINFINVFKFYVCHIVTFLAIYYIINLFVYLYLYY